MDGHSEPARGDERTIVERRSDRELVVTRIFDAPPHILFKAWTTPELFMRWWAPKSIGVPLLSCEMDARTGGFYRLAFGQDEASAFVFFGKYIEVVPGERIVWTNDEDPNGAVTTVTFTDQGGRTLLVYSDLYPSKQALDEAQDGAGAMMPEQFEQLDALLAELGAEG